MSRPHSINIYALGVLWAFVFGTFVSPTRADDDFPTIVNNEADTDAEPMPASESAATMRLPSGFQAKVFASEPQVQNPIAMAWDTAGRLWVAENYTYSDRSQHFDLSMRDRVITLRDTDGDGHADERHVFTDKVQMLTSVEVGHGGVWLMCPPQLLFIPDRDANGVPDGPPQVMLDGFTVARSNYHNFANGLRWGPDGWLYGRCGHSCPGRLGTPGTPDSHRIPIDGGIWRYHPKRRTVEVLCHGTVNPWGHDWDEHGELFFVNTVIGHLWHLMPGAHFKESFGESANPLIFERLDMIADHYHYDRTGTWHQSRAGAANSLGGGHAHMGTMIYQGNAWPEPYRGKLFTLNMHGLRANVESVVRQGCGYVASHEPDFLISKDPFFRGLDISSGPDGQVYMIDWSDTGECHDHTGVHRTSGRIYKIEFSGTESDVASFSKPMCLSGDGLLPKIWKGFQSGELEQADLFEYLNDNDEHVRVAALRLLTDHWPFDTVRGPLKHFEYPDEPQTLAKLTQLASGDPSGLVQLALASTLQRLPIQQRPQLAAKLLQQERFAGDRSFPSMVWYGLTPLVEEAPDVLARLAVNCRLPTTMRWMARALAANSKSHPQSFDRLLASALRFDKSMQESVLRGIEAAFEGWLDADKPEHWSEFESCAAAKENPELVRKLSLLFGNQRALDEMREIVHDPKRSLKTRQSALESLIRKRPDDLRNICESLLDQRELNATAAHGLSLFDQGDVGTILAEKYFRFHPKDRPTVIEILVSRVSFANALLDQMEHSERPIPRQDISAYQARQIIAFDHQSLSEKLTRTWGSIRKTPLYRKEAMDHWKTRLTPEILSNADLSKGRMLFNKTCSQCHQLYGEGHKIGPDLTGSQRSSLDYLLTNILDPSSVVGKDYRMSIVLTADGRVLNGLVVAENDHTLVMQLQNSKVTLSRDDLVEQKITSLSPMPEGLFNALDENSVRDLIAYLMSPVQVTLPD